MTKYVRETAAGKSISAWVILKGSRYVATVQAYFGGSRVLVNIWQAGEELQTGTASGYGYDKLTAALAGLKIDGHELTDHCGERLKKPRGNGGLWPRDFKAPKGYSLANWTRVSAESGRASYSNDWREKARADLGLTGVSLSTEQWLEVESRAAVMLHDWEASDDCVSGYTDVYRDHGLTYLEAHGYSVHSAI